MKKIISILTAAVLVAGSLTACGSGSGAAGSDAGDAAGNNSAVASTAAEPSAPAESPVAADAAKAGGLKIVTTIFPEYDWVMNILGDNASGSEVTMLLDNGVDLHSYQPTAEDILKISTSDVFIYVGGESDGWVDDALQESVNKDMAVINLLEVLGDSVKEEEMVEGMQGHDHDHDHDGEDHDHEDADHDHEAETDHDHEGEADHDHEAETDHDHEDADHDHETEADHDHEDADHDHEAETDHDHEDADHDHEGHDHEEGEVEYDEHVWLSLRNTETLVNSIADAICEKDPGNAGNYKANADAYTQKLKALDEEYAKAVEAASVKTLLFGDRFPFRYLVDDYGLSYYAAFVGCSAETEASFETITFLAGKVDELSLHAVMTIEGKDHRIAETIVQSTKTRDQQILTMDSMQATTSEDVANGTTYMGIMESNLEVLKEALK